MQVEHKTERGTVLFVKVPDDSFSHWHNPVLKNLFHYHTPRLEGMSDIDVHSIELDSNDWQLIGLTSEVTEERAETLVKPMLNGLYYDYLKNKYSYYAMSFLDSFKSLMQHLQVYEANPYDNYECDNHWCDNGYIDMGYNERMRCQFCQENEDKLDESEPMVGKWIVLFKPND